MTRKVRWGVLSTAKIGTEKVLPAMQRSQRSVIAAIASRDRSRAQAAADALGIAHAYGSYEELLADPDIEAIYNPLPNHMHAEWTIRALQAGKHVLCEKPVALDADEAGRVADAAARTGRLCAEAFMVRHHPQWQKTRDLVSHGRLGDIRSIQTSFSYYLDDPANIRNQTASGGGGLYDIGCYAINTARYLFGAEPDRVVGAFDMDPIFEVDRMLSGLAVFAGARHLAFVCSTQLVPYQRVQVMGTRARVEIVIPFNAPPDQPTRLLIDDGRDLGGAGIEEIVFPAIDQYTLQGDAFSRAVQGEEALAFPIADAVLNMRVIDALFRSGRSHGWERP